MELGFVLISFLLLISTQCYLVPHSALIHSKIFPQHEKLIRSGKLGSKSQAESSILSKKNEISLGGGIAGMIILLVNRLSQDLVVSDAQSRADIIAVLACSAVLLNSLSETNIQAREREPVALIGYALKSIIIADSIPNKYIRIISWACKSIFNHSPATSVHFLLNKNLIAKAGIVGESNSQYNIIQPNEIDITSMPILSDAVENNAEVYLPDLQILPGKIEFNYLPVNAQSVLIVPFRENTLTVVVSTNKAKSLKISDILKIKTISSIFNFYLSNY